MSKPFEIVNCEDCVFFADPIPVERDVSLGLCRRFPPRGKLKEGNVPNFPTTLSNYWCGEGRGGSK